MIVSLKGPLKLSIFVKSMLELAGTTLLKANVSRARRAFLKPPEAISGPIISLFGDCLPTEIQFLSN